MRTIIPFIAVALATQAHAADFKMKVVPAEGQAARMENGSQQVDDRKYATTIRLLPSKETTSKRVSIRIFALNGSASAFDFGPENIAIEMADGTTIPMLTYDNLAREQRNRVGWQKFGLAMRVIARSMAASTAGRRDTTVSYAGRTYGRIRTYDGAAAAQAFAAAGEDNSADALALEQDQAAAMASIDNVMQTTTVDPGAAFGGIAFFDLPPQIKDAKDSVPIKLVVTAGGEDHIFQAVLQKIVMPPKTGVPPPKRLVGGTVVAAGSIASAPASALLGSHLYAGEPPRPYHIIGPVKASLSRATIFSPPVSDARIQAEIWEKAEKLGADAVVNFKAAAPRDTLIEKGKVDATGMAVKFDTSAKP